MGYCRQPWVTDWRGELLFWLLNRPVPWAVPKNKSLQETAECYGDTVSLPLLSNFFFLRNPCRFDGIIAHCMLGITAAALKHQWGDIPCMHLVPRMTLNATKWEEGYQLYKFLDSSLEARACCVPLLWAGRPVGFTRLEQIPAFLLECMK